jgi:hypothetical protein
LSGNGPGGTPVACDAAKVAAFAEQVHAAGSECATVVRLNSDTYQLLGYAIFCGPAKTTDATAALARATQDVEIPPGSFTVSGPAPKDEYHFMYSNFGNINSLVSVRNGLTVLGAVQTHPSGGLFLYPKSRHPRRTLEERSSVGRIHPFGNERDGERSGRHPR